MKKKAGYGSVIIWVLVLCICLSGCGSGKEDGNGQGNDVQKGSTQSESQGGAGEESGGTQENVPRINLSDLTVSQYVTLGQYKGLAVTVASIESQLEDLIQEEYYMRTTADNGAVTDRAVKNGDVVNIDYVGKKDGVAFDGGTATASFLGIGTHTFIDGFEEGLVGAKPGETLDLNLTFPENYGNADLAGAQVVFTVTVNYIVAGMTDEIIAAFGSEDYSTVEQLRQYVHDNYYEDLQYNYDSTIENELTNQVLDQCQYANIPEDLLNQYQRDANDSLVSAAAMYGLDGETFTNYFYGLSLADTANIIAEVSARQALAFQAIAEAESLTITDEQLQTRLAEYAASAGVENVDELLTQTSLEEYREYFMIEDVLDFLVENAVVTEL